MIEVYLDEEYESSINVLYNHLSELITYMGNLSTYEEVKPQDKKVIDEFIYDAQQVYGVIRNTPLNTDITIFSPKPKLKIILEHIELLYSQIRSAVITVCPELNDMYKQIRKIIVELQLENLEKNKERED